MSQTTRPMLSIGIIFRNDIRCIERCLRALQPLRDAVACELVMADTGSEDGSRAVAEKYADIIFDFPWINDFAAARNAVINRSSGRWYLTVDTDEYLDPDISELKRLLRRSKSANEAYFVTQRNYTDTDMTNFSDFFALRLVHMASTNARYQGAIHEGFRKNGKPLASGTPLTHTILHHDGYVGLGGESGRKKRERNIALIREKIEQDPDDLMARLQFIESGATEEDLIDQIREAIALTEEKKKSWDRVGPAILRQAVFTAHQRQLPELEEWTDKAFALFPKSLYTRLDVSYISFMQAMGQKNYAASLEPGRTYLQAIKDYNKGVDLGARAISVLRSASPYWEQDVKIFLAHACAEEGLEQESLDLIEGLDFPALDVRQTENLMLTLQAAQVRLEHGASSVIVTVWDGINQPSRDQKLGIWEDVAEQRRQAFLKRAAVLFQPDTIAQEKMWAGYRRPSCTMFQPLESELELGSLAAIMAEEDPAVLEDKLSHVDNWETLPIFALAHALECGVSFPPAGRPMTLEEIDSLAGRLVRVDSVGSELAVKAAAADFTENIQGLAWTRALVLAAVQVCSWKDVEQGRHLVNSFVRMEREFLPRCYAAEALTEQSVFLLPSMHRFGWYCIQAFDALEAGDSIAYVKLLREGLSVCRGVKPMVEFLLDHTKELQASPLADLRAMADQIRAMLANFSPDDPAVAAIRSSEAYQKVAYLIEGMEVPVIGGQMQ